MKTGKWEKQKAVEKKLTVCLVMQSFKHRYLPAKTKLLTCVNLSTQIGNTYIDSNCCT